jgi:excisionase family DNA binding protein
MPSTTTNSATRRWVDKRGAAAHLSVSETTVKRLMATGALPFHKIRARVLFDIRDLDAFVESCRVARR